jgi:hypothetical protein
MPEEIGYDEPRRRLMIGKGFIDNLLVLLWRWSQTRHNSWRRSVQDQPSISDDRAEPQPRPKTIPDDFIWDVELQGWIAPGSPEEDWDGVLKEPDEKYPDDEQADESPHLISNDEPLISNDEPLAAAALSVSPTGPNPRRTKRVAPGQLSLFGNDTVSKQQQPAPCDPDVE